ncbi:MAG: DUF4301 family protein [Fermentimonas sp.]|nr:DUF4301 family protein [Fermentimonas sp.]
MYTKQDLELLKKKGITESQIETQLDYFKSGFPFLQIVSAASIGNGILKIEEDKEAHYMEIWSKYLNSDKTVTKFVPASGAASRMFKDFYTFYNSDYDKPTTDFEKTFFRDIQKFAFYGSLDETCKTVFGKGAGEMIEEGNYKDVVAALLSPDGLDYGSLPKGLLLFHHYPEGNRTPVGEHLTEGVLYAKNAEGKVNVHFTVSEEHMQLFELLVAARKINYEHKLDAKFSVTYSIQKPATDTIAVDMNNEPFREEDGTLLFRPGGHGALIENLNDIDSDIIFIKNVDNVVPDRLKADEARYKKLLAGVLVSFQQRAFEYLTRLESDDVSAEELSEMLLFTKNELCISNNEKFETDEDLKKYLKKKLDRPFRVCGMVKNVGEPGGGPFIAVNSDGTASLQILESSQIDKNNPEAVKAFNNGSHFNPVDLVCGVKCYQNNKFNLTKFVDKNTGFISQKSKDGKDLKALELPGLWNGAMSDWNTVFVEIPVSTFNPVKTVNDLLRPEHQ